MDDLTLTADNDQSVILFGIFVDRGTIPTSHSLYPDFYKANYDFIVRFLSKTSLKAIYNNSETLQEFYNQLITAINFSTKQFVS